MILNFGKCCCKKKHDNIHIDVDEVVRYYNICNLIYKIKFYDKIWCKPEYRNYTLKEFNDYFFIITKN
jgi:hypothetical protein